MGSILLNVALKYFESHPEQVASLLEQAVEAGINALKKHNASQK